MTRKAFHFLLCLFYCVRSSPTIRSVLSPRGVQDRQQRFAYIQYASNLEYLCNSLMIFDSLQHLHSKEGRVLMYPNDWKPIWHPGSYPNISIPEVKAGLDSSRTKLMFFNNIWWKSHSQRPEKHHSTKDEIGKLLARARDHYNVKLAPVPLVDAAGDLTRLYAFKQTEYDRLIYFDSDSLLYKPLDDLFNANLKTPLAMPRAYWQGKDSINYSTALMLIQPSRTLWKSVQPIIRNPHRKSGDMDFMNHHFRDKITGIRHNPNF